MLLATPDVQARTDVADWLGEPSGYRDVRKGHTATEWTEQFVADSPDLWMAVIAEESLDFGECADTSNVGDATLEHYASQVRRLASDYQHAAPYPLFLEAKRLRDRVFRKLQGHQRPGQTRDLYLMASQVCGMLAWMSGDLGYRRAAQTQAWTACVCAEQADHDGARAWVRATQTVATATGTAWAGGLRPQRRQPSVPRGTYQAHHHLESRRPSSAAASPISTACWA